MLVVIGLILISLTLTLGRGAGWSDTLRGVVIGVAVGLEITGLIVLLRGLPRRQGQA